MNILELFVNQKKKTSVHLLYTQKVVRRNAWMSKNSIDRDVRVVFTAPNVLCAVLNFGYVRDEVFNIIRDRPEFP